MPQIKFRYLIFYFSFCIFNFHCSPGPLSRDECIQLLYQNSKVIAEDDSIRKELKELILRSILNPSKKNEFIAECKKTRSRKRFECEMNAKNFTDLRKCAEIYPSIVTE